MSIRQHKEVNDSIQLYYSECKEFDVNRDVKNKMVQQPYYCPPRLWEHVATWPKQMTASHLANRRNLVDHILWLTAEKSGDIVDNGVEQSLPGCARGPRNMRRYVAVLSGK